MSPHSYVCIYVCNVQCISKEDSLKQRQFMVALPLHPFCSKDLTISFSRFFPFFVFPFLFFWQEYHCCYLDVASILRNFELFLFFFLVRVSLLLLFRQCSGWENFNSSALQNWSSLYNNFPRSYFRFEFVVAIVLLI